MCENENGEQTRAERKPRLCSSLHRFLGADSTWCTYDRDRWPPICNSVCKQVTTSCCWVPSVASILSIPIALTSFEILLNRLSISPLASLWAHSTWQNTCIHPRSHPHYDFSPSVILPAKGHVAPPRRSFTSSWDSLLGYQVKAEGTKDISFHAFPHFTALFYVILNTK